MVETMTNKEFSYYWGILSSNYNLKRTQENQSKKKFYYECLKELSVNEMANATKNVIKTNRFFPNVNEILAKVEQKDKIDELENKNLWNGVKCEIDSISSADLDELEKILNEIGGSNVS